MGGMKSGQPFFIKLLIIQYLSVRCFSQGFDFFYFVQQWPGSYCHLKTKCCYPTTGKPDADFGIHGLWPNYNNGSHPSRCDSKSHYDESKISDLISSMQEEWPTLACLSGNGSKFWAHEWTKHGTCSESVLSQHQYFQAALNLKKHIDLLQIVEGAGIHPDGESYSLDCISDAIRNALGVTPGISCNLDYSTGNSQLYQVYICIDISGKNIIECPVPPGGRCASSIEFPKF